MDASDGRRILGRSETDGTCRSRNTARLSLRVTRFYELHQQSGLWLGHRVRAGWQAAFRDAVMMKFAYGYRLRFNELRHLQAVDFAGNPHAREFGAFGICKIRYGTSRRSSPHKGRGVLTVSR